MLQFRYHNTEIHNSRYFNVFHKHKTAFSNGFPIMRIVLKQLFILLIIVALISRSFRSLNGAVLSLYISFPLL